MIGAIMAKKMAASSFDAFNRGDLKRFMANWAEDAIYTFPGNSPISGETKGREAIEQVHDKMAELFPKMHFNIKETFVSNIFAMGATNDVAVEYDITYNDQEGKEVHNSAVSIIRVKGGKVVAVKDYVFNPGNS